MAYNVCIPIFEDGEKVTGVATTPVAGKTFLKITANRQGDGNLAVSDDTTGKNYSVGTAGAGDDAVAVAEWDAAIGEKVGLISGPGHIVPVVAGAAIAAGQSVQSDANGRAIPLAAGKQLGIAMTGAASGADAEIKLRV